MRAAILLPGMLMFVATVDGSFYGANIQLKIAVNKTSSWWYCPNTFNGTKNQRVTVKIHSVNNDKYTFEAWAEPHLDPDSNFNISNRAKSKSVTATFGPDNFKHTLATTDVAACWQRGHLLSDLSSLESGMPRPRTRRIVPDRDRPGGKLRRLRDQLQAFFPVHFLCSPEAHAC
jgi:hypothetical protein